MASGASGSRSLRSNMADDPARASGTEVRFAEGGDLPRIKTIADRERQSLGFVHRTAVARAIERREVVVAMIDDTVAGFCHFYRRRDGVVTIYHLAVDGDVRRQGVARDLVQRVERDARDGGARQLRLKCPTDLEANAFYQCVGFSRVGFEHGATRSLAIWERELVTMSPPTGDALLTPPRPSAPSTIR